ncbi:unnamed protein product, partial [Polarella glacialis]
RLMAPSAWPREQLERAEASLASGNWVQAADEADFARELFADVGDVPGEAEAIRVEVLGRRADGEQRGVPAAELDLFAEIELARFRAAGHRLAEGIILLVLAECNTSRRGPKRRERALELVREALDTFRAVADTRWEARALLALVNIQHKSKYQEGMHESATLALGLARELGDRKAEALALHASGLAFMRDGDAEAAIAKGRQALEIFREIGDHRLETAQMSTLAQWQLSIEGYQSVGAAQEAVEALKLSRQRKSLRCEASALQVALCCLMRNGDTQQAFRLASESLPRMEKDDGMRFEATTLKLFLCELSGEDGAPSLRDVADKAQRLDVVLDLAQSQLSRERLENAGEALAEALALSRELGHGENEAKTLRALGQLNLRKGDQYQALDHAKKALKTAKKNSDRPGEAAAWMIVAAAHHLAQNQVAAQSAASEAQLIFEELGDLEKEAQVWHLVAELHLSVQKHDAALQAGAKRLELCRKGRSISQQADALNLLTHLHLLKGHPEEAEREACEMLRLARLIGNLRLEVGAQILLVQVHIARLSLAVGDGEQTEHAQKAFQAADQSLAVSLQMSRQVPNKEAQGVAQYWKAEALACAGRFEEALRAATQAGEMLESSDQAGHARSLALQASLLGVLGELGRAKEVAQKALSAARSCGFKLAETMALEELERLQKARSAPSRAAGRPRESSTVQAAGSQGFVSEGLDPSMVRGKIVTHVMNVLSDIVDFDVVDDDSPFMDIGMDSLSTIDLQNQLAKEFPFGRPSVSMLFDFPTVRELTDHIVEESKLAGL